MKWYANTKGIQGIVCEEDTGKNIAVTYDPKDAVLIASAPEMLEALEEIVNCPDYRGINTHEMKQAIDAIKKAKGE